MGVRKIIHADMDAYSDGSADEVVLQQATLPRSDSSLEKLIGHNWALYSAANLQIAINRGANPKINYGAEDLDEPRVSKVVNGQIATLSREFPTISTDRKLHYQRDRIVGGLQTIFSLH
jgi:hypothetical protein